MGVAIQGEGMPKKGKKEGDRGDLFITLQIEFPQKFTDTQKDMIRAALAG